ncbi:DUF1254 domain-containing protein [Bradyrhizobium manausense]|uniref:DUF1254 domain-containing protein n=1 Tax=Bradyrhizobium manausense TaxID=989370 RepID=UPI001BAA2BF4|nr:DUF1214 domain-containing protein [Bradyrhizobium manausense]MBR0793179.1 DUF1254 domain-containing protein [Bradyrhizobium manausense]
MKKTIIAIVLATSFLVPGALAQTGPSQLSAEQAREEKAYAAGVQVALWGRPFVDSANTLGAGLKAGAVGLNYFRKFPNVKTAADRFVNTPNNVSLDGYGAADLTNEPVVVSIPAINEKRWYIVQVGNYYDQVIYNIGGSKGPEPGLFVITGPDYSGPVPSGMKQIKSSTRLAVVASRVFVKGEADLPGARAVQQGIELLPLSVFQEHGLKFEVPKQYDYARFVYSPTAPEPLRVFDLIGFGMKGYLSPYADFTEPDVGAAQQIGLSVAKGFDWQSLDEPTKRGLARAAVTAQAIIEDTFANSAEVVNGWRYQMNGGRAGFNYAMRAAFAAKSTGANVAEEVLYPNTRVDDKGAPFSGANKYILHFDKDQIPPVSVFWNLNLFDDAQFFIENDFKRYSIGSTTDGLKTNPDGSITILIQNERPPDTSNWLPAPKDAFNLTMRLYGAQTPILNGSYRLPAVKRVQ